LAALERIDSAKAQELLEKLAAGPEGASLTKGAAETLQRIRLRRNEPGDTDPTTRSGSTPVGSP
jgi:hypothetical protein